MPVIDDASLDQLREQLAQAEHDGQTFMDEIQRLRALLVLARVELTGIETSKDTVAKIDATLNKSMSDE